MKSNVFFQQLRREMEGNPYQDRFLKELQEHAEDLKEAQSSKKSLTPQDMKQYFGEPKEVKKTFVKITQPWKKWQEAGGALGYGILIAFWLTLGQMIGILQGPYFNLTYLVAILLVTFPYLFIWQHLFTQKNSILSKKVIVPLVILPSFFGAVFSALKVILNVYHPTFGMEIDVYTTLAIGSVVIGLISSFFFPLKKEFSFNKNYLRFIAKIMAPLFFLYITVFAIFNMLDHSFYFPFFLGVEDGEFGPDFLDYFFVLAHHIEHGLLFFPMALFNSIYAIHFFQMLIILALFASPIVYFIIKKRFSWLSVTAFIYSLFFIVIPQTRLAEWQKPYIDHIDIHVPYVNVSQMIEKRQYGPFYNMVHYLKARYVEGFGYKLSLYEDQFVISQSDTYYSFSDHLNVYINDLQPQTEDSQQLFLLNNDEEDYLIQKADVEVSFDDFSKKDLPNSFTCKRGSYGQDGKTPDGFPVIHCEELLFKDQKIMNNQRGFIIADFVFSQDQTQLLIATNEGVYLLNLSSISSS